MQIELIKRKIKKYLKKLLVNFSAAEDYSEHPKIKTEPYLP